MESKPPPPSGAVCVSVWDAPEQSAGGRQQVSKHQHTHTRYGDLGGAGASSYSQRRSSAWGST